MIVWRLYSGTLYTLYTTVRTTSPRQFLLLERSTWKTECKITESEWNVLIETEWNVIIGMERNRKIRTERKPPVCNTSQVRSSPLQYPFISRCFKNECSMNKMGTGSFSWHVTYCIAWRSSFLASRSLGTRQATNTLFSVTPTDHVYIWSVIVIKRTENDRYQHVILTSVQGILIISLPFPLPLSGWGWQSVALHPNSCTW